MRTTPICSIESSVLSELSKSCHPWLANYHNVKIPLDMIIYKLVKAYICSSSLRKAALGMSTLQYRKLDFEEFCAAAITVHQLEGMESWEQHARSAYELFEKDGNRPTMTEELASELGLSPSVPVHVVLQEWIRQADGKLSFLGFVKTSSWSFFSFVSEGLKENQLYEFYLQLIFRVPKQRN